MPRAAKKPLSSSRAVIPVRALDFVRYNTKDMCGTRAFYQKLFGFKRGDEWTGWWSEFATAPLTLCLNGPTHHTHGRMGLERRGHVSRAVDDVPAAIAKCRKRRVKILIEPVETRVCWMACIADPAGNRICLHSHKDGSAG